MDFARFSAICKDWGVGSPEWSVRIAFPRLVRAWQPLRRKDVKTIQGLLRHAKVTTTLDLHSQSIDSAKLEAQEDIALAITSTAAVD